MGKILILALYRLVETTTTFSQTVSGLTGRQNFLTRAWAIIRQSLLGARSIIKKSNEFLLKQNFFVENIFLSFSPDFIRQINERDKGRHLQSRHVV